jgi:hypothetical protein
VLGPAALGSIREEAGNEGALHEKQDDAACDVPLVLVPRRRGPEPDHAARGEPPLVESPALELAPVEQIGKRPGLDDGNPRGGLPAKDPQAELRGVAAVLVEAVDVPTDRPQADVLVERHVDRSVGGSDDP